MKPDMGSFIRRYRKKIKVLNPWRVAIAAPAGQLALLVEFEGEEFTNRGMLYQSWSDERNFQVIDSLIIWRETQWH